MGHLLSSGSEYTEVHSPVQVLEYDLIFKNAAIQFRSQETSNRISRGFHNRVPGYVERRVQKDRNTCLLIKALYQLVEIPISVFGQGLKPACSIDMDHGRNQFFFF